MTTLHLNLKKKWFDMILSGEKKEEYRDMTEYWENRLIEETKFFVEDDVDPIAVVRDFIKFDTITFSNGYSKERRQFVIENKNIRVGFGKKVWGAIAGNGYFVITLGNIIHKNNFC